MGQNYYDRRHLFSDQEITDCYLKHKSQTKAASELGISRETVARAVRRMNIPLTGRKYNSGQNNGQMKFTNEDLIKDSQYLDSFQLAKKYNVDIVNIYRRSKRLGLNLKGDGNKWKDRCNRYGIKDFDKTITLEKVIEKYNGICQLCGKPINRNDIQNKHIGKRYPTVDHIKPLSRGGTHTWDNVQLAHMSCNSSKCDKYVING